MDKNRFKLTESSFGRSVYMILPFAAYYVTLNLLIRGARRIVLYVARSNGELAGMFRRNASSVEMWCSVTAYVVTIVLLWLLFRKSDSVEQKINPVNPKNIVTYLCTFVAGGGSAIALNSLAACILEMFRADDSLTQGLSFDAGKPFLPGLILYVFLSPLLEEMTFRWLTYERIKKVIGETQAVLITSVFFALVHGNVVVAVYAFIMGMIMVLIYRQSKTFALCVIFHMSANVFVFISAYVL